MNDNNMSFFKYIKFRIITTIKKLKENGIRGSWKNVSNKAKETILIVSISGIAIIICVIFGIKEVQRIVNENFNNNTGVIINIDNNSDSKIYKTNNNILIENDYRTAQIIADESLCIRKEPNTESKIIGTLPSDYMIQVSFEKDGWCKLYNNPGWISVKYIKYIN